MEARFINRRTPCEQDMVAFARVLYGKYRIVTCVLSLAYWAFFAYETYCYYWDGYHTFLLVLAVLLSLYAVFFPRLMAWRIWRSRNKKVTESTLAFHDDCVHGSTNLDESKTQYDAFVRLVETEAYFYLFVQKRVAHVVAKDGFILGDPAGFAAFISEKTGLPVQKKKRKL